MDSTIPAVDAAQKAGDNASNAMRLCDLATLMRAEYSSVIAEVDGNPQSVEELEALGLREYEGYFQNAYANYLASSN